MHTKTLSYTHETINNCVEQIIESASAGEGGLLPGDEGKIEAEATRTIAGFTVIDEGEVERLTREIQDSNLRTFEQYLEDRTFLNQLFSKDLGFAPLAVLPKRAWQRIYKEAGLVRVPVNLEGYLGLKKLEMPSDEEVRKTTAYRKRMWHWIIGLPPSLAYFTCLFFWPQTVLPITLLALLVAVAIAHWVIFEGPPHGGSNTSILEKRKEERRLKKRKDKLRSIQSLLRQRVKRLRSMPQAKAMAEILRPWEEDSKNLIRTRVHLPNPPPDIARLLCKVSHLDLKVVADPKAISFPEDPISVIARDVDSRVSKESKRVSDKLKEVNRKLWEYKGIPDPIIYHEHGSAVAIIAQYGDFPAEKKVVDEVVRLEYLP